MRTSFNSLFSLIERACPWLFCLALALAFVHHGWMYCKALPEWLDPMISFCQTTSRYLCYGCILAMLRRHPWYVLTGILVLWFLHLGWEHSGRGTLYNSAVLVLASRGCGQRRILWIFLCALIAQFVISNIGYWCGVMGDLTKHRYGMAGHSWGTTNPNMWAAMAMLITMLALLLCRVRRFVAVAWVSVVSAVVVLVSTLSITTVLVLLALPFIYWVLDRYPGKAMWTVAFPWLGLAASVALMFCYEPSMGETTFESRFSMAGLAFEQYGVSLMGQNCGHVDLRKALELGIDAFCIDNLYLRLLLYFGILPMTLILAYLSYLTYCIVRSQDWLLLSVAICFMLIALMEAYPVFATMNFTLYCGVVYRSFVHPE